MQSKKSLRPAARLASFGHAFRGVMRLVAQEPNAKLHVAATVIAITLGFVCHITKGEWLALLIVVGMVWLAEALNTCVEMLCDLWCKGEYHPQVRVIKDIAAAGVLLASVAAAVVGVVIFLL